MELINEISKQCKESSFSRKITTSPYCESQWEDQSHVQVQVNHVQPIKRLGFRTAVQCIVAEHDELYLTIPESEKQLYLRQQIQDIATKIDEERKVSYSDYGFNERRLKPQTIQNTLGLGYTPPYRTCVSALVYLNEVYGIHCIIVSQGVLYETTPKGYPKVYLEHRGQYGVMTSDECDELLKGDPPTKPIQEALFLDVDVTGHVYRTPLRAISTYKADELKAMCQERGITLKRQEKNKAKAMLYDDLYNYFMNNP